MLISTLFIIFAAIFFSMAGEAHAMHIAEGILPLSWAALWFAVALPFIAYGLYDLKKKAHDDLSFKPLAGLMAAVVFIISCMPIPVPLAGTCSHPCGTGISGILIGPAISVVIATAALIIQALFLGHGGLSTLGADIVSMGVMGSFAGYLTFRFLRACRLNMAVAAFLAGLLADWATYLATSVELAAGIRGESAFMPLLLKIIIAFLPTQLPLGILEGAMTAGMVLLLYRKRPDILVKMKVIKAVDAKMHVGKVVALLAVLIIAAGFWLPTVAAQAAPWRGVDEAVIEKVAGEQGREARESLINLGNGDLPLFLFLLAGTIGGFAAGYYWRMLIKEKKDK